MTAPRFVCLLGVLATLYCVCGNLGETSRICESRRRSLGKALPSLSLETEQLEHCTPHPDSLNGNKVNHRHRRKRTLYISYKSVKWVKAWDHSTWVCALRCVTQAIQGRRDIRAAFGLITTIRASGLPTAFFKKQDMVESALRLPWFDSGLHHLEPAVLAHNSTLCALVSLAVRWP